MSVGGDVIGGNVNSTGLGLGASVTGLGVIRGVVVGGEETGGNDGSGVTGMLVGGGVLGRQGVNAIQDMPATVSNIRLDTKERIPVMRNYMN